MSEWPRVRSDDGSDRSMFVGKRAEALSTLIDRQMTPVFAAQGLVVPVRSCSLLLTLDQAISASAADLAKVLDQSHQLVLQKMPALIKHGLVERFGDPDDRRRRVFRLTDAGRRQVALLNEQAAAISRMYDDLYDEIGVDLFAALGRAIDALERRDVGTRLTSRAQDAERR